MFPTDDEFFTLYVMYGIMAILIVAGILSSSRKMYFRWNAIAFISYLIIMGYIFSDAENFKFGNSLVVLFYSACFVTIHFAILGLIELIRLIKK